LAFQQSRPSGALHNEIISYHQNTHLKIRVQSRVDKNSASSILKYVHSFPVNPIGIIGNNIQN